MFPNDILYTFNLYFVYHAAYLWNREQWFRTAIALSGFIVGELGKQPFATTIRDLFESQTKIEMCVAIQRSGTRLNHTTLWMDPSSPLCPSVLSVCSQICSQRQGEGYCQVAHQPNKSPFLCTTHITNGYWSLAPCLGRTVKFWCKKWVRSS